MRKVLAVVLAVVLVGMFAYSADAQVPNIQVYFDNAHTQSSTVCRPGGAALGTLYVAANNFNNFAQAVEFRVQYPSSMQWLGDTHQAPLVAGIGSNTGIALSYLIPQNAFGQWRIMSSLFFYECVDCSEVAFFGGGPQPIVVGGYLLPGDPPRYSTPGGNTIDVLGMTSLICPGTVAIEEKSWGGVKSLYTE